MVRCATVAEREQGAGGAVPCVDLGLQVIDDLQRHGVFIGEYGTPADLGQVVADLAELVEGDLDGPRPGPTGDS